METVKGETGYPEYTNCANFFMGMEEMLSFWKSSRKKNNLFGGYKTPTLRSTFDTVGKLTRRSEEVQMTEKKSWSFYSAK